MSVKLHLCKCGQPTLQNLPIRHHLLDIVFGLREEVKDVHNPPLYELGQLILVFFIQDLVQHSSQGVQNFAS